MRVRASGKANLILVFNPNRLKQLKYNFIKIPLIWQDFFLLVEGISGKVSS